MSQKVLVFGDIGIDDTAALIYGYFDDNIDIVGVVANYGNISREKALANVHYVKNLFDISPSVEVITGAESPMTGEKPQYYPEIHGEYGLGPIIPPSVANEFQRENFFKVMEIIRRYSDELVIVNIGRLTSLAMMFILYQKEMSNVRKYYIMGGAFWTPGNVTAVAEANFYGDPMAAHIVLKYAHNTTIIPLNVTEQAIVTPRMVDYISQVGKAKILKPLLDYYYAFYKQRNPSIPGSPLHDVVTLMAVSYEDMFQFERLPVQIVRDLNSKARGQSIADIRPYSEPKKNRHRVALELDYRLFYVRFMSTMTGQQFG
ncbi:nucleoside hydrolase [Lentibacillus cibarius]|uniref:Nucleoside hydrolase n=1 Tax=Lentibacillus cibarius TaxID=2583219 RepID=A0A5S3QHI0_9BACI|nr:nucleoside hydrolase [Lentibacillus cibarius]TMN21308.1 nucleoside hydrolase [Lentibacillus cibarius]